MFVGQELLLCYENDAIKVKITDLAKTSPEYIPVYYSMYLEKGCGYHNLISCCIKKFGPIDIYRDKFYFLLVTRTDNGPTTIT